MKNITALAAAAATALIGIYVGKKLAQKQHEAELASFEEQYTDLAKKYNEAVDIANDLADRIESVKNAEEKINAYKEQCEYLMEREDEFNRIRKSTEEEYSKAEYWRYKDLILYSDNVFADANTLDVFDPLDVKNYICDVGETIEELKRHPETEYYFICERTKTKCSIYYVDELYYDIDELDVDINPVDVDEM